MKIKRPAVEEYHHKLYIKYLFNLKQKKNVFLVDSDVAPIRLINSTSKSISMPFTSTSIIAKYYNKITCFYDPINILNKSDRATQGVDLISGKNELNNWILKYE